MLSTEQLRTAVGILGNIISFVLFLSPLPTFYQIWKKRSVEQYSAVPYLVTFFNCGLWVLYGLPVVHPHSTLVITINGAGLLIELIYISLYLIFSPNAKSRLKTVAIMAAECVILAVLAAGVLSFAHTTKLRSTIVGSVCMGANILMYASPLSVMKLVLKTKSVEYMPFFLSFFSFLNGLAWTGYAFIRFDPFIFIPNGMGSILGLAQLLLYGAFYKSTKRIMAARKAQGELAMSEKVSNLNVA